MTVPDPYATWNPTNATDDPDGHPDKAIVPLVELLRANNVTTLQSCAGHAGHHDGHLWIAGHMVSPKHVLDQLIRPAFIRATFTHIRHTIWPECRWEIGWEPDAASRAILYLGTLRHDWWDGWGFCACEVHDADRKANR